MPARVLVAVGETSGDRLARAVVGALRDRGPVDARGVVGAEGRASGITAVHDLEGLHAVGLWDGLQAVGAVRRNLRALAALASAWRPHVMLTVDAPSFTLRAARAVRAQGVPVVHVGAPQVWAWRPGRRRRLGRSVDQLLCLLPFEPDWFIGHVPATYVGHPATHRRPRARSVRPTLALLPGSRPAEVRRLWPVLRQVARRVVAQRPEVRLVAVQAPGVRLTGLAADIVPDVDGVADAWAAVAASGTVTLELAALAIPQVVVYRTDPVTAAVGRRLVTVGHLALPNLVRGGPTVPEFVQELPPPAIALAALAALNRPRPAPLDLDGAGAVDRMADEVGAWLPTV